MNLVDALVNVAEPDARDGEGGLEMTIRSAPGLDMDVLDLLLEHAYRRGHADGWAERDASTEEEKRTARRLIVQQAVRSLLDYLSAAAKGLDVPPLRDVIAELAETFALPEYMPDPMPSHSVEDSIFTRPEPPARPLAEDELVAAARATASAEGAERPAAEHSAHVTGERGWPDSKVAVEESQGERPEEGERA